MKKTIGKLGLVCLSLTIISLNYYDPVEVGYFTNDFAEFISGPALVLTTMIMFIAVLDMAFKD